ncbi:uncharacterized protein LOC122859367 isoform X2 [Aphidius gifuensis]|uniref:uncharacterized protein LOC122859367 isoform X2 n=1 Tax=Aphidius gifuensis TaxID=684658 RepID=UPI001CDD2944|nr:uncharacterized protein LOC122859367 isoform X2 [Aphidius gifuensis]
MSFIFYKNCIASNDGGLPEALHQQLQQLSYPEDSEMGIFFALAVPLDDPVSTKSLSVAFFFEANYKLDKDEKETMDNSRVYRSIENNFMSRKKLYSILESKLESFGLPGKSCILRFICETSEWSTMHYHNGLIGDLFRLIFTLNVALWMGMCKATENRFPI